jgi:hypothetical protein
MFPSENDSAFYTHGPSILRAVVLNEVKDLADGD